MAHDEGLAQRIREMLQDDVDAQEVKMFGGLAFLVNGHMAVGIVGDELMVRVGPDEYEDALDHEHAREMDFTGKPMRGLVFVGSAGLESDDDLERWIARGVAYVSSLRPKPITMPRRR